MAKEFAEHGIRFAFVYVREAHPGEAYPCQTSAEQKLRHARDMVKRWNIERPMLVDDLDGTVHRAYGSLPNMTYIVSTAGTVIYRASWTDARSIRLALDQIIYERGLRRAGTRITPFYVEWMPQRPNDRATFLEGLINDIGPRAVEEYIAAVAHTSGESGAKIVRDWWAMKQSELEVHAD